MNPRAPFRRLVSLARARPKAVYWLAATLLGWVGLCFALGYRLPWFDRHPDWREFPTLTNPHLAVEEIPDSLFNARYASRFHLPVDAEYNFEDYYRTNIKNVRSLGFQVTDNDFDDDIYIKLYPSPTAQGSITPTRPWRPHFNNKGYEYLEIYLGNEKGHFKATAYAAELELIHFYQYNYPKTGQDTLLLRYWESNYRVYVRR